MIGAAIPTVGRVDARTLPRVFTNTTRCTCGCVEVRVHYCPGCRTVAGDHVHRECPIPSCGATWLERFIAHGHGNLDDPHTVFVCHRCRRRVPTAHAATPRCCGHPDVHVHDVSEPCDECRRFAA